MFNFIKHYLKEKYINIDIFIISLLALILGIILGALAFLLPSLPFRDIYLVFCGAILGVSSLILPEIFVAAPERKKMENLQNILKNKSYADVISAWNLGYDISWVLIALSVGKEVAENVVTPKLINFNDIDISSNSLKLGIPSKLIDDILNKYKEYCLSKDSKERHYASEDLTAMLGNIRITIPDNLKDIYNLSMDIQMSGVMIQIVGFELLRLLNDSKDGNINIEKMDAESTYTQYITSVNEMYPRVKPFMPENLIIFCEGYIGYINKINTEFFEIKNRKSYSNEKILKLGTEMGNFKKHGLAHTPPD